MENVQNQAILFIALGTGGIEVLAELPRAAQDLSVRITGPFSSICLDQPDSPVRMSHCGWLSDLKVSASAVSIGCDTDIHLDAEDALFKELCGLIRRLSAGATERGQRDNRRTRIQAYVIIDLDTQDIVPAAVQMIQLVRQVEPSLEMTGLALTSRTVNSGHAQAALWFEQFKTLLSDLQQPYLLQRLYILDGIDAKGTWLPGLGHMYHIGAEFILHHGLSPFRHYLRRHEKTRASFEESFLNYCGSLACRHFSCERSTVEKRVAAVLAQDQQLVDMERGSLSQDRSRQLDRWAQQLTTEIAGIYERDASDGPESDSQELARYQEEENQKVLAAIKKMLNAVCAERPVLSLRWFLKAFGQRLRELGTFSQLRVRWDARYRVAESLRKQMRDTYRPINAWQKVKDVRWRSRFDPWPLNLPTVVLNQPVPKAYFALGMSGVILGLVLVTLAGVLQSSVLAAIGGMGAIAACAFRVLGTGWRRHERTVVSPERGDESSVPLHAYAACVPALSRRVSAALLTLGLACMGWAMWSVSRLTLEPQALLFGPVPIVCALAGAVMFILSRIRARWPEITALEQEVPDLAPPLNRRFYYAGLGLFMAAWVLLCVGQGVTTSFGSKTVLAVGSLLTGAGLAVALYPRARSTRLIYRVPGRPAPLEPVPAKSIEASRLMAQVARLRVWVEGLIDVPEEKRAHLPEWRDASLETSILDMFSPQWAQHLADEFNYDLQSESEASLVAMAQQPTHWVAYVMQGLSDSQIELSHPLFEFSLQYVRRWLKDKSWREIIARVNPDPLKIHTAITAAVPPRWPQPRIDPEVDTSMISVGTDLWDLIAPFVDQSPTHRFERVEWQDPNTMTVTRIVQGCSAGWRGYEGLPGQVVAGRACALSKSQPSTQEAVNTK